MKLMALLGFAPLWLWTLCSTRDGAFEPSSPRPHRQGLGQPSPPNPLTLWIRPGLQTPHFYGPDLSLL